MAKLAKSEEEIMRFLWERQKAYLKEIRDCYPDPKPAITTLATLLKRLQAKGVVSFEQHGKSRQYFPLIKKKDYFATHLTDLINRFFNNSPAQFASFFTEETDMTQSELEELKVIISNQIKDKK